MIRVTNTSRRTTFDVEVVYSAVRATLKAHDAELCEVSVLLTDDVDIKQLNRDYRGIDAPTDVLAFSMREGEDGDVNRCRQKRLSKSRLSLTGERRTSPQMQNASSGLVPF